MAAGINLTGDWGAARNYLRNGARKARDAKKKALIKVGEKAKADVKKGIQSGAPGGQAYAPNSSFTTERKGSEKPMIQDGDFIGSINRKIAGDAVFVGVLRSARSGDGESLANIAAIHEGGKIISVTPKMRGWYRGQGASLKRSTTHIRIPARPTFGPTIEAEKDSYQRLFTQTFAQELRRR